MIRLIKGSLLDAKTDAIAHCCNCFNVMGAGVALQIRNKYPEVFERDSSFLKGWQDGKLGRCLTIKTINEKADNKYVFNLYGQFTYGRKEKELNYEAIYSALERMKGECVRLKIKSAALPYGMGCGLAGGDWQVVSAMIHSVFGDDKIDIYIYKLEK